GRAEGWVFRREGELVAAAHGGRFNKTALAPSRHPGVVLSAAQPPRLNIELAAGGATEAITVTDQPPVIDPSQPTFTTIIETEKIAELPVRSRNYLNFVLLAPGVASSTQPPASSAQTPLSDSGFTFGG